MDSQFSGEFDFNSCGPQGVFGAVSMPPMNAAYHPYGTFPPYEVDIKTETQVFVNDVPTRRDSTISTFSAFQTPPTGGQFSTEGWLQQESYFEQTHESFTEEPVDFNFFDFNHAGFDLTSDQSHCPFSAHIRKTRPRADLAGVNPSLPVNVQAAPANSIIRSGIPYGPSGTVL